MQEPILRRVTRTWIAVATSAQRLDAQRQIRLRNVVLFALCVLSIVLMMASLEVALVMPEDDEKHKTPTLYYEKSLRNFFAAAQLGVTLLCWVVLYAYYALKWQTNCRHSLSRRDPAAAAETNPRVPPLHRSHFWKPFLVELVVLGVQPLPWMDQDWYELLSLAIFARLYVGLRVLRDFSPIYAHRDELVWCRGTSAPVTGLTPSTMLAASAAVRRHPTHRSVLRSSLQTPTQGEATAMVYAALGSGGRAAAAGALEPRTMPYLS